MATSYEEALKKQQEDEALLKALGYTGQNTGNTGAAAMASQADQVRLATENAQNNAQAQNAASGYAPGSGVLAARQYLQSIQQNKPAAYQNRYSAQLEDILGQIQGRAPFAYNAEDDPLYGILADAYTRNGRRAMQDTLGEATALTGGYNNSYAQSAAQQSYNRYMDALSEKIPELEARAYQRYNDEGDRLLQNYQLLNQAENQEYSRSRDTYSDWLNERQLARQDYDTEYSRDYGMWQDARNFAEQVRQFDQNYDLTKSTDERDYAYKVATAIMQKGMLPSAELLMQAGISEADAKMIAGIVEDAVMYGGGNGMGVVNTKKKSGTGSAGKATTQGEALLSQTDAQGLIDEYNNRAQKIENLIIDATNTGEKEANGFLRGFGSTQTGLQEKIIDALLNSGYTNESITAQPDIINAQRQALGITGGQTTTSDKNAKANLETIASAYQNILKNAALSTGGTVKTNKNLLKAPEGGTNGLNVKKSDYWPKKKN